MTSMVAGSGVQSALSRYGVGAPLLLMAILAMMVVPLKAWMLDGLFTFNISLALVVIMAVIYSNRPMDFAIFPTIILISTLMRLSLNVASTRVVLLEGHNGTGAAGQVIKAFGDFVVGGNYTVGLVVFAILVIINFVVVTKGAGRISEVSARFTLDAMPGKQMAIDADLNAGVLTQEEARIRRSEVGQEADFYGAMDGASKFVRGDAVAGILILFINLIGGLAIGMVQHGMTASDAMQVYALLTIGDGLVAQIPSLLLSTASAIMVSRVSSAQNMSSQVLTQLFENPRALAVTAVIIGIMGLIPGMPNVAFLTLAAAAGGGAWMVAERKRLSLEEPEPVVVEEPEVEAPELSWDDVAPLDIIGLEVGYRLIPIVDRSQGGQLLGRIKGVRKKLSQELGFLFPPVHIRDNLDLPPNGYRITLRGVRMTQGEVHPERELAINPGQVFGELKGTKTVDPVFDLEAVWIEADQREQAQTFGYTVVDASTVIATHLSQVLQDHAYELLGHEEVQQLLDRLAKTTPKLIEDLVPKVLPLGTVVKILQNLLQENVPIRDMRSIVEALAQFATNSQDPAVLTSAVRVAQRRLIVQHINGLEEELAVITLDPNLEQILQQSLQAAADGSTGLEPGLAERLHASLVATAQRQELAGTTPVLLTADAIRPMLSQFVRYSVPGLRVLAYGEVPDDMQIRIVATVGGADQLTQ